MTVDNEALGQRLQECREACKVTQAEMAKATGHSKNYISALEHGTNKMAVPTLIAYANKLEMSIDDLLGYTPKDNILPELKIILNSFDRYDQEKILQIIKILKQI